MLQVLSRWARALAPMALGLAVATSGWASGADSRPLGPRLPARATAQAKKRVAIDWKKEIIYFLLVDRFADGNPGNNGKASVPKPDESHLKEYQGGDLEGVISKLDYLKGLGITTLWLSPVMDNANRDFVGWWPYHGYHPVDHYAVEERFGDMKTMQRLVKEAHRKGIKVLLDMVYNQVGPEHPWVVDPKNWEERGFKHWFHPHSGKDDSTSIKNWQNQDELENKELAGLPDLDQSNPNVYDYLLDVSRYWVDQTGADGFRLDAVKHINPEFWKKINADMHNRYGKDFLMLGEVFDGDPAYVAQYQEQGFSALFDIPLYFSLVNSFAAGNSMEVLSDAVTKHRGTDKGKVQWSTLVDNHDVVRFSYKAGKFVPERIKLALDFISAINGIPVLYYGTEVALEGGPDKDDKGNGTDYLNRRMMPWDRVEKESQPGGLINHIKTLFAARKSRPSLYEGEFTELYKSPCVYVFGKVAKSDVTVAAFNNCEQKQTVSVPVRYGFVKDGETLTDLLGTTRVTAREGKLALEVEGLRASLFNAQVNGRSLPEDFEPLVDLTEPITADFVKRHFAFKLPEGMKAQQVFLAGSFNGWNPRKNELSFNKETGLWEIDFPLRKGRHVYKFVVDGTTWLPDPSAKETENDNFGGRNSVVEVP